jgi:signal transduction histidine kinase
MLRSRQPHLMPPKTLTMSFPAGSFILVSWTRNVSAISRIGGLKELADTFDAMLARLDAAFASQRRFVANASHELRTPLTEMRALIDVSLAKPARPAPQLEVTLAGVRAAVDKSEELIEALLTLARSDRGLGHTEVVDLPTAVEDAIDQTRPAAAAGRVRIDTALERPGQRGSGAARTTG